MATLEVRIFGDPVLRQKAHEVTDFDGRLATLAEQMLDTMRALEGVGLAANQVGVLKRLFTWELAQEDRIDGGAVVNPTLIDASDDAVQEDDEGCLSFPGLFYPVTRPLRIAVAYQDLGGAGHEVQLEGLFARVWLHEMDHLDGILFIDHLAEHDRKQAMRRMREERLAQPDAPAPARPGGLLLGPRDRP